MPLKTERGNRVFPISDKAQDVVDTLVRYNEEGNVTFLKGRAVSLLQEDNTVRGVRLENGKELFAGSVILACGGASYPGTGSNGDGYRLAQEGGHSIRPLKPSLVPLVAAGEDCRDMMGLSCGI